MTDLVIVKDKNPQVVIVESNVVGPAGPIGLTGPQGPSGADGSDAFLGSFTVAAAPSAAGTNEGKTIYVTDEIDGPMTAFSDGVDWRRLDNQNVITTKYQGSTMQMDFVLGTAMVSASTVAISSILSCTRTGSSTADNVAGSILDFAANALRITDKGLLIEEARTSLALYPQDMTQWPSSTGAVASSATGIDFSANNQALRQYTVLGAAGTITGRTYTCTIRAKCTTHAAAVMVLYIYGGGTMGFINVPTFTLTSNFQTFSFTFTSPGEPIYTANTAMLYGLKLQDASVSLPVHVEVEFMCCEEGDFATSLIKQTSAQTLRPGDKVKFTNTGFITATGTWFFIVDRPLGRTGSSAILRRLTNDRLNLEGDTPTAISTTSLGSQARATAVSKIALSYDGAGRSIAVDGAGFSDATTMNIDATDLHLGSQNGLSEFLNGRIKEVVFWPTRKTQTELEALTT